MPRVGGGGSVVMNEIGEKERWEKEENKKRATEVE